MAKRRYHLANIRDLLINGFNDLDLRRLCYDVPDFRPVYDELAQGTGKAEIVDRLIEYADRTVQLDALLALARERNPARYEMHGPYLAGDGAAVQPDQARDLPSPAALPSPAPGAEPLPRPAVRLRWYWIAGGLALLIVVAIQPLARNLIAVTPAWWLVRLGLAAVGAAIGVKGARRLLRSEPRPKVEAALRGMAGLGLIGALAGLALVIVGKPTGGGALIAQYNLGKRDLAGAHLSGADLRAADLSGADLTGATVTDEQLAQARSLQGATMPDGTVHE